MSRDASVTDAWPLSTHSSLTLFAGWVFLLRP